MKATGETFNQIALRKAKIVYSFSLFFLNTILVLLGAIVLGCQEQMLAFQPVTRFKDLLQVP